MGELFEFESIKQAKSQREIPNDDTINGIPYVVQSVFNNMVARNVNKNWLIENNEPPVSGNRIALGVTLPAVSYQSKEFGASQIITAKAEWLNEKRGLFIAISITKLMHQFSYGRKPGMQIYREMKIQLPIQNGEIDFAFMENFIAELEAERIAELEAYLSATGLQDYLLTVEEEKALKEFDNWKFEEFTYQSIFNKIIQGRRLRKEDQISGTIPFVMAGTTNTGVVNYISNPVASFPKNSITIDIFGNTFYRNYDFGAGDDTGVYWNDKKQYSKEIMLYYTTTMNKSLVGKFSFGKKLRSSQSLDFKMILPSTKGEPAYAYMEVFIKAVQKLVIKDVVQYAERKVAATRAVVK